MADDARRVKLKGDSAQAAHTIELKGDGTLVAELYDFSDDAHNWFGGDIAWLITVQKEAVPKVLAKLKTDSVLLDRIGDVPASSSDSMLDVLSFLPLRFDRFGEFEEWLKSHDIPYLKATDTWA